MSVVRGSSSGFLTEFSRVTQNLKKNMVFFKAGRVVVTKKKPQLVMYSFKTGTTKVLFIKVLQSAVFMEQNLKFGLVWASWNF